MKNLFLFVLLQCICLQGWSQYFSGDITYTVKIIPKDKNLNVDSILNLQPGTTSLYSITNGFYKSTYFKNDEFTYSYTYDNATKRMYDEQAGKEYITFRDSRKGNNIRIRSIPYKDSIKVIAGYKCFMVERVYEGYISKIYYATDLRIDPESFKDHAVGDWYNQIKEMDGAVSLGSVNEYATHYEVHEVTKVNARPLSPADFALPNKLIAASESALDKPAGIEPLSKDEIECYRQKVSLAMEDLSIEGFRSYTQFIISDAGEVNYIEPYEEDEYGLFKVAIDIISSCGIKFKPGQIAGKPMNTLVYFPIDFAK